MQQQDLLGLDLPELPEDDQAEKKRAAKPMSVTGVELAEWFGITPPAITQLKKTGVLATDENGLYDLKTCVRTYCNNLRMRKTPKGDQTINLEASLAFWKVENEKQKNLQWRIKFGQVIGSEMLRQLTNIISALRSALANDSEACNAVRDLLESIGRVDLEDAIYSTLNEVSEDELGEITES